MITLDRVFVGLLPSEAMALLQGYLNEFMPGSELEVLAPANARRMITGYAASPDVVLIILDNEMYNRCSSYPAFSAIKNDSKLHKYQDEETLNRFLISKFGYEPNGSSTPPPDVLMGFDMVNDAEGLSLAGVVSSESDGLVGELQEQLSQKDLEIYNLNLRLEQALSESNEDYLTDVIRDLRKKVEDSDSKISELQHTVDETASVRSEAHTLKTELKDAKDKAARLEYEKTSLDSQVTKLADQLDEMRISLAEVDVLRKQIEEKDIQIANLEELCEAGENADDVIAIKEKRIAELTDTVKTLSDNLKEANLSLDSIKEQAENTSTVSAERISELESNLVVLQGKIGEYESKIEFYQEENKNLQAQVDSLQENVSTLDTLRAASQEKDEKIASLESIIESSSSDAADRLSTLTNRVSELESTIKEKDEQIKNLGLDIAEHDGVSASQIAELKQNIEGKDKEIEALKKSATDGQEESSSRINELTTKVQELETEVENRGKKIETLEEGLKDSGVSLSEKDVLISELQSKVQANKALITESETRITALESEKSSLEESLSSRNTDIADLKSEIKNMASEKQELIIQIDGLKTTSDSQSEVLDRTLSEKVDLEDKIESYEEGKLALESRIEELTKALQGKEDEYATLLEQKNGIDTELTDLKAVYNTLQDNLTTLQEELIDAKAAAEGVERAESDLLEERRKSARLASELEVLKKTQDTGKGAEYRTEIARLRNELDQVQKTSGGNFDEVHNLQEELERARTRISQLEMDLSHMDGQVKEMTQGVFGQMSNLAVPSLKYNVNMGIEMPLSDKLYCVAGGCNESNVELYRMLSATCKGMSKTRILVVDLSTDSSIDVELGSTKESEKIVNPIPWLQGVDPLRKVLVSSKYSNARLLSTALVYMNNLFLLNVDWGSRLSELANYSADVVLVNVGCLSNVVSKLLFCAFSKYMKSFVVVKATPTNLRATMSNLAGCPVDKQAFTVECCNFISGSSDIIYKVLASKYNSHIVRSNDILQIQEGR